MPKLTPTEIQTALQTLPNWHSTERAIRKTWKFPDFIGAMTFVNNVAQLAEEANHHPNIDIRYNKVILSLVTHDEGGITSKDIKLARQIEAL